jgi:hypothetical protein
MAAVSMLVGAGAENDILNDEQSVHAVACCHVCWTRGGAGGAYTGRGECQPYEG